MILRFDFFYENADVKYFLALLQKLAIACSVDLRTESSAEILSVFASAESSDILGKFANFLQAEVPHSLYFKLKHAELCNELRGEKITLDLDGIFSVSEIKAIKDPKNPRFCEISADSAESQNLGENQSVDCNADSASLKSTLQNICTALQNGQSVALSTSRGEILLSTKSNDFDFILANDIATINLYTRALQDEISALASFEKPLIELAIKEVFVREVGAKCAKFILPFDIILYPLSSILLEQNIAFVRGKFAESSTESSKFFEIVVGQNGYFLHKNYVDSADFREFLALNFGAESSANNIASKQGKCGNPQNIIIYLSLQNPSIFACDGEKIINIAFDKNPKNILQKITTLENGEKLIANFGKEFKARYEAILSLDSAPQMSENLLDIFECAAMILGQKCDKSTILNLAQGYLRDIGPKIDFKNYYGGNSSLDLHSADFANLGHCADFSPALRPKFTKNHESQTENPSVVDSANLSNSQNLGENQIKIAESTPDSANPTINAESANKAQQTIEGIAVEVAEFLGDFECKTGLKSAQCSKSPKSPQDAPKTKLQTSTLIYDELRTVRSIISFTLAGTEPEVVAFGILESLADYLVLLFRDAQNQFGAKNITIAGDMFANKVFFDKITKKIPTDFKLIFPKYLDISSARRASCKT